MTYAELLLSTRGRIARRHFWGYNAAAIACIAVAAAVDSLLFSSLGRNGGLGAGPFRFVVALLLAWPGITVGMKRWHDVGKSGTMVILHLVPVLGAFVAVFGAGLMRGTAGPNAYGSWTMVLDGRPELDETTDDDMDGAVFECSVCGGDVSADAIVCPHCGEAFEEEEE